VHRHCRRQWEIQAARAAMERWPAASSASWTRTKSSADHDDQLGAWPALWSGSSNTSTLMGDLLERLAEPGGVQTKRHFIPAVSVGLAISGVPGFQA
jgi:hypothetical protein